MEKISMYVFDFYCKLFILKNSMEIPSDPLFSKYVFEERISEENVTLWLFFCEFYFGSKIWKISKEFFSKALFIYSEIKNKTKNCILASETLNSIQSHHNTSLVWIFKKM